MDKWKLPTSLNISGVDWNIRTDFRDILEILKIFSDPEYDQDEKCEICIRILYENWEQIPLESKIEAAQKAVEFIDMGMPGDKRPKPTTMDWEQDAPIVIPAINKVIGKEVRSVQYMHWWTFLGAYMEIGNSLFSNVVNIRIKKAKRKKLEKHEQEFYRENKELIDLKKKYTASEKEENERLLDIF